jgi:hypothetical protein
MRQTHTQKPPMKMQADNAVPALQIKQGDPVLIDRTGAKSFVLHLPKAKPYPKLPRVSAELQADSQRLAITEGDISLGRGPNGKGQWLRLAGIAHVPDGTSRKSAAGRVPNFVAVAFDLWIQ